MNISILYNLVGIIYQDYDYDNESETPPAQIHYTTPASGVYRVQSLTQQIMPNIAGAPANMDSSGNFIPVNAVVNAPVNVSGNYINNIPANVPTNTILLHEQMHNRPNLNNNNNNNNNNTVDRMRRLEIIREKPINTRILEVFMEIDQLGHYTDSSWFLNLDKREYYNFFREMYNIWRFRAQIPQEVKNKICPFDPFMQSVPDIPYQNITFDELRNGCLKIIENIVCLGVDTDHRNLGAFHVLSALTIVSVPARNSMRWLYESVY